MKIKNIILFIFSFALPVLAADYYWAGSLVSVPGDGSPENPPVDAWGDYGDLANWRVGSLSDGKILPDTVATVLPGKDDVLKSAGDSGTRKNYHMDLGGQEWFLNNWSPHEGWWRGGLSITNGTLTFVNGSSYTGRILYIYNDATLKYTGGTLQLAHGDSAPVVTSVNAGGSFILEEAVTFRVYKHELYLPEGATASLGMGKMEFYDGAQTSKYEINGGHLIWPNGVALSGSGSGETFNIIQNSGTMTLGGELSAGSTLAKTSYTVNGGTIHATGDGDCSVSLGSQTVADSASATLTVDETASFDISSFTFGENATLAKNGQGIVWLGESVPSELFVVEGAIGFRTQGMAADASGSNLANATKIVIGGNGITMNTTPSATDAVFAVDVTRVDVGAPFLISSNADLLQKALTDINAVIEAQGYTAVQDGNSLVLDTISVYTFKGTEITDITNPEGWICGYVPEGEDVFIEEGGRAVVSSDLSVFRSISLKKGAVLEIESSVELPRMEFFYNSELSVRGNATVKLLNGSDAAANENEIPKWTIAEGATIIVPTNAKLKNLNLDIAGTLTVPSGTVSTLTLGYAEKGETTYFGLTVRNKGRIKTIGSGGTNNNGRMYLVCPDAGGTVIVPNPITFTDCSQITNISSPNSGAPERNGITFGQNNPVENPFTVELSNSKLYFREICELYGACKLFLKNGAELVNFHSWASENGSLRMYDQSAITVDDTSTLAIHRMKNSDRSDSRIEVDGTVLPAITFNGGSSSILFNVDGKTKGKMVLNGASLKTTDSTSDQSLELNTFWVWENFQAIELADGTTSRLIKQSTRADTPKDWFLYNIMGGNFTGSGNFAVTNAQPEQVYTLLMASGTQNTGSGNFFTEGDAIRVLFDDTATWGGTVVANGNIALTNTTAAAETSLPATVSLAGVELTGTFPIRVWTNADTGDVVCDQVNLGDTGYINNGGYVEFVAQDETDVRTLNAISFGTAPVAAAKTLPAMKNSAWMIRAVPVEGDETKVNFVAFYVPATLLILK